MYAPRYEEFFLPTRKKWSRSLRALGLASLQTTCHAWAPATLLLVLVLLRNYSHYLKWIINQFHPLPTLLLALLTAVSMIPNTNLAGYIITVLYWYDSPNGDYNHGHSGMWQWSRYCNRHSRPTIVCAFNMNQVLHNAVKGGWVQLINYCLELVWIN